MRGELNLFRHTASIAGWIATLETGVWDLLIAPLSPVFFARHQLLVDFGLDAAPFFRTAGVMLHSAP